MADKLKPCPFCGSTAFRLSYGRVECSGDSRRVCPIRGLTMQVRQWNRRGKGNG